ncbi:MAG: hypoxanthine phosphoribosyltransferase [Deltaproteobacteria bacterium]|nr:hypoxanthine phosphoribosyltransferase [Deltaproteobacteria bacterium]MBW2051770.1 hypoxanthine phosphoribosyltransferase [Deltaproteobacteria bacterium]MBW2140375.1 hypoxanthine phosphoribosyltransferase [Deltaproteobacteria bacterium]MBW2322360.1 hypoxanthine phosphoribosyltransferase [Deltaproteobacteria bacterium]
MSEPEKKLVFSQSQIENRVRGLAKEISQAYQGKDLVLVGVLNGVFIFLSDLVKEMTIPLKVDFVRLASYGPGSVSSGKVEMKKDIEQNLEGRHVLIVDDIADGGLTLDYLKKHLTAHKPASIKICVLIDKKERRSVPVEIDFTGFEIERGFLVGYGLDYDEQYRYLRDIYHLIVD